MTQTTLPTQRIDPVRAALTALGRRQRAYAWGTAIARAVWVTLLGALVAVLFDAAFGLPEAGRLAALAAIAVLFFAVLVTSVRWKRRRGDETLHHARELEQRFGLWSNPLTNALFLAPIADQVQDDFSHRLAQRSIERGRQAIEKVDVDAVLDRESLARELGWLWAVIVAWLVVLLIHPALAATGLSRIVNPFGQQDPVSLTQIDVRVNPDPTYVGEDATVTAEVTGRLPDRVEMVELDEQGRELRRWPMQQVRQDAQAGANGLRGSASFERHLRELREPMTFRVEAGNVRSQPITIAPVPRPAGEATRDESRENESAGSKPGGAEEAVDGQSQEGGDGGEEQDDGPSLSDLFPELFEKIRELGEQAGHIGTRARKLFDAMPDDLASPEGQAWREQMEQLQKDVNAFQRRAHELAGEARRLAEENPEYNEPLEQLAQELESLGLLALGAMPDIGEWDGEGEGQTSTAQSGDQPGAGNGQSQFGQGQDQAVGVQGGGGTSAAASSGFWLAGTQQAGRRDQSHLGELMQQLQRSFSSQTSDGRSTLPEMPERTPGGRYREEVGTGQRIDVPDAFMQQTPPAYRDLVRQYRERVSEDEARRSATP